MTTTQDVFAYRHQDVISKFAIKNNYTELYSEHCFIECIRFLYLADKFKISVTPSKAVDDIWHIFISYTKDYREFCQKYLKSFIDHIPCEPDPERYVSTIKLIHKEFGFVNKIWGFEQDDVKKIITGDFDPKTLILYASDCNTPCQGCSSYSSDTKPASGGCVLTLITILSVASTLSMVLIYFIIN